METGIARLFAEDPTSVGPYRLVGRLGAGGQGVVYLAEAPGGGRVALKVIRAELGSQARWRFEREFAVLRRVSGFCTAQVLDADIAGATPYIVSEYVPGPSLQDFIERHGPRRGADLERLAVAMATALTAIHRAGIVHRDVKPQNVLMGPDGPRVIDFGIARVLEAEAAVSSARVGTPRYMAPEQIRGERFGTAADVFAWGTTIVFAATGRSPFHADSLPAVMERVLHGEPDLGGLSGPLRGLVAQCLAMDPALRPAASDLLVRIMDFGVVPQPQSAATVAAPAPVAPPASGGRRRTWWWAAVATAMAVVLVGAAVWSANRTKERTAVIATETPGREPPAYALAALGTARTAFEAWYSLDHADYDGAVQRTERLLSGVAAQDYEQLALESRDAVLKAKATQTARATATGIVSASPERVSLIIVGLSHVTQGGVAARSGDPLLFAEMVPAGGGWTMDYARTTPSSPGPPAEKPWPPSEIRTMMTETAQCQAHANINGPKLDEEPEFFGRCLTGRADTWWRELAAVPDDQVPDSWTWQYREIGTAFEAFDGPDAVTLLHLGDSARAPERKVVAYRLHVRRVNGVWKLEDVTSPKDNRSLFEKRPE